LPPSGIEARLFSPSLYQLSFLPVLHKYRTITSHCFTLFTSQKNEWAAFRAEKCLSVPPHKNVASLSTPYPVSLLSFIHSGFTGLIPNWELSRDTVPATPFVGLVCTIRVTSDVLCRWKNTRNERTHSRMLLTTSKPSPSFANTNFHGVHSLFSYSQRDGGSGLHCHHIRMLVCPLKHFQLCHSWTSGSYRDDWRVLSSGM
jgi:hypothetical protein